MATPLTPPNSTGNPSRSETLTGRMLHNIKQTGEWGGSKWSMHVNEDLVHNHTFLRALKEGGDYNTGLFGKASDGGGGWFEYCAHPAP